MNRNELNKAIFTVLTTAYKKDAPEAFKVVQNAGYEVNKYDGQWEVRSKATGRWVRIEEKSRYNWETHKQERYYEVEPRYAKIDIENPRFDFAGYLEKPVNPDWRFVENYKYAPTKDAYCDLKHERNMIDNYEEEVERAKKELIEVAEKIARYSGYLEEHKGKLNQFRREHRIGGWKPYNLR